MAQLYIYIYISYVRVRVFSIDSRIQGRVAKVQTVQGRNGDAIFHRHIAADSSERLSSFRFSHERRGREHEILAFDTQTTETGKGNMTGQIEHIAASHFASRPALRCISAEHESQRICNASQADIWKATKEYPNHSGTKIRVFRVCLRAPFLPPSFPHFSPSFPFRPCLLSHHSPLFTSPCIPPFID